MDTALRALLNSEEVAELPKISDRTVSRLPTSKELPEFKATGVWRLRKKGLEARNQARVDGKHASKRIHRNAF